MSAISPVASTDGDGRLFWHYPVPGVTNPTLDLDAGELVHIVGHVDDPAATTCLMQAEEESQVDAASRFAARDPAADIALCRLRFVVTDVTVAAEN